MDYCSVGDVKVHYRIIGEGRPLVMLHGWSLDHGHMLRNMEPLFVKRSGWQRIYFDLPGHGRTPAPDWIDSQDRILEVVLGFIDTLLGKRRFTLAGASAGAYLARGVLYHRMRSVDGILMTVPLIYAEDDRRTKPAPMTLVHHPAFQGGLTPEEADIQPLIVFQKPEILEELRRMGARMAGLGDLQFQSRIRQDPHRYAFSFDVDDLNEPYNGPALVVTGRQDSSVGYWDALQIIENFSRGTFAVLDCAGHFLEEEQEILFQSLAAEWLNRVELFAP